MTLLPRSLPSCPDQPAPGSSAAPSGLSCPSCQASLTLPPAMLGQVVSGPCPACGGDLVFRDGRLEVVPVAVDFDWEAAAVSDVPVPAAAVPAVLAPRSGPGVLPAASGRVPSLASARNRLARSGTPGMAYLDDGGGLGGAGSLSGAEAAWAASTPAVSDGRDLRGWGWGLVVAVGVGGLALLGWWAASPPRSLPAPQPPAPDVAATAPRRLTQGWEEAAHEAWLAFAAATTAEEKLAHVLDPERVAPSLRAYYAADPGSDERWAALEFQALAGTPDDRRRGVQALGHSPKGPGGRPLIVFFRTPVAADGGGVTAAEPPRFRLDWETYIQERDRVVETFLDDPGAERAVFRLAVERVHLFDEPGVVAAGPEPLGLKLRTPSGVLLPRPAVVRPRTALHARINEQLRWGAPVYATVQLAWDARETPEPRVVVADLVCWQFAGLGGVPEVEVDLSPVPAARLPTR